MKIVRSTLFILIIAALSGCVKAERPSYSVNSELGLLLFLWHEAGTSFRYDNQTTDGNIDAFLSRDACKTLFPGTAVENFAWGKSSYLEIPKGRYWVSAVISPITASNPPKCSSEAFSLTGNGSYTITVEYYTSIFSITRP